MALSPLRNYHNQIVDALGSSIVSGEFAEGAQLPTEPQLAETYGASRLIIREAMKSLAAKGLVSIRPRTGTRVQPRALWNLFDPAVLGWHSSAPREGLIEDLMELRQAIEPLAARLAAQRATPEDIAAVREAFTAMSAATTRNVYIDADLRFHGAVVRACGNSFIMQLETALSAVWETSFQASSGKWGPDAQALKLHQQLFEALERRNPAAAEKAVLALIDRAVVRIKSNPARQA
ncbi:FadR/GntR family transcriptional regulator [Ramlibacter agri]|uniref:FadR/GntR family transcriptional regulator n=1 Tax=Ramlibacter agri TaxID=2728837 RepID=UPI001F0DBEDD|nr:FadR/GntR family transcriptional regulator [Ramlibacter agri]